MIISKSTASDFVIVFEGNLLKKNSGEPISIKNKKQTSRTVRTGNGVSR